MQQSLFLSTSNITFCLIVKETSFGILVRNSCILKYTMSLRPKIDIVELFSEKKFLKVCAPMVRYSKLEFRSLVRNYGCDLCFTPMIMADSFVQSDKARQNEFTTNESDKPLVVQFAAKDIESFADASELVSPFCDGVDLNCGCPQRWAMSDGYGAHLLTKPQLIKEIVLTVRNRISKPLSISVKMRLLDDIKESIEMCRNLEAAGVSFLTIHGRKVKQRGEPVNIDAIRDIVQSVNIPVIANGGVKSLQEVYCMKEKTHCNGVMSAQGILQNPALFSGEPITPKSCVEDWIRISLLSGVNFQCFHHHLVFMLEKVLPKELRKSFNRLSNVDDVLEFLSEHMNSKIPEIPSILVNKSTILYKELNTDCGKYFRDKLEVESEEYFCDSWFC